MENIEEDAYACPSFNSYTSDRLAEIALKVVAESSAQNGDNNDDEDFEFSVVRGNKEVLADEIVYEGQIGPIFPVFNRDLLLNDNGESSAGIENERLQSSITVPLSKLFFENRENRELDNNPPSCSSSEEDELENIPAGTYCVWRPKAADSPSPSQCKKSNSTGSTPKKWTFRDLLRRSNSEGKDNFVYLSPKNQEEKSAIVAPKRAKGKRTSLSAFGRTPASPSAHEALYTRNRAMKEGDKKKSYLPYRQDLVGFFVHGNSLAKSFPHL
ncbi:hypothetical protein CDL12_18346 [Handroanthus impetiginosus]|uniref:Uncharacterized protein n=1 Tax=Handroanthus impetiginosus TaxID=429701 RepID=A0A2G9GUX4_9LAMI|nr:hypothetical protein CDL12_18346 [Handroanthus impetiginosus]